MCHFLTIFGALYLVDATFLRSTHPRLMENPLFFSVISDDEAACGHLDVVLVTGSGNRPSVVYYQFDQLLSVLV